MVIKHDQFQTISKRLINETIYMHGGSAINDIDCRDWAYTHHWTVSLEKGPEAHSHKWQLSVPNYMVLYSKIATAKSDLGYQYLLVSDMTTSLPRSGNAGVLER